MKSFIALILFVIVIIFNVFLLKPTAKGLNNEDLKVPDITMIYNGKTIYNNYFLKLDPEVIPIQKKMILWDYAYPIVYTAFLYLMGQLLFKNKGFRRVFYIALFTAFILDYAENSTQIYLLNELPEVHYGIGSLMGIFTTSKWILAMFTIFSVLGGLITFGYHKIIGHLE